MSAVTLRSPAAACVLLAALGTGAALANGPFSAQNGAGSHYYGMPVRAKNFPPVGNVFFAVDGLTPVGFFEEPPAGATNAISCWLSTTHGGMGRKGVRVGVLVSGVAMDDSEEEVLKGIAKSNKQGDVFLRAQFSDGFFPESVSYSLAPRGPKKIDSFAAYCQHERALCMETATLGCLDGRFATEVAGATHDEGNDFYLGGTTVTVNIDDQCKKKSRRDVTVTGAFEGEVDVKIFDSWTGAIFSDGFESGDTSAWNRQGREDDPARDMSSCP